MRARKAVIFGSGGFTQDPVKSLAYLRGPIFGGCGVPTNTGDLVDIGLALGTQLGNMNNAFWVQNLVEQALQFSSVSDEVWIPYGDSMIYVNKFGNRFTNEKMVYNERTQSHFHWEATPSEYTQLAQFMIYDSAVASSKVNWAFRFGNVPLPGVKAPYVISGDTWAELAANINARLTSIAGKASITGRVTPLVQLDDSTRLEINNAARAATMRRVDVTTFDRLGCVSGGYRVRCVGSRWTGAGGCEGRAFGACRDADRQRHGGRVQVHAVEE